MQMIYAWHTHVATPGYQVRQRLGAWLDGMAASRPPQHTSRVKRTWCTVCDVRILQTRLLLSALYSMSSSTLLCQQLADSRLLHMQQLQGATSTSVTAEAQPACHHADRRLPILHETQFIRAQLLSHTSSRKPIAAPTASNMLAASAAPPCAATAPHQHQQEHPLQLPIPALDNQVPWGLPNAATASNRCRCNPSRGCTCAPAAAAGSAAQLVLLQPAVVLRQQQARPHGKALLRARRRRLAQRDGQHAAAALAL